MVAGIHSTVLNGVAPVYPTNGEQNRRRDFFEALQEELQFSANLSETVKVTVRDRLKTWVLSTESKMRTEFLYRQPGSTDEEFDEWLKNSEQWWAYGNWTDIRGILDWHITQYSLFLKLRDRRSKKKGAETKTDGAQNNNPIDDHTETETRGTEYDDPIDDHTQTETTPREYYDPIFNRYRSH